MKSIAFASVAAVLVTSSSVSARAQENKDVDPAAPPAARDPYALRPSVMAGLTQWVLFGGGNVAAQLKVHRLAFEYSHGQALDLGHVARFTLTDAERAAGVKVAMTWTTGGGVGVEITPRLHVLLELKAHRYEITGADANQTIRYTSLTVGPGIFYDIYLFDGFFVQPNLRWWPTVASTYDGKGTLRTSDGRTYAHERHDLVPFLNVNVGYTFAGI